ncbi:hypothetical protein PCC8801_0800 [Rippkaea orientalis PCC 8801]|uniref:Uncharacterized protein n=1 Tax=Rippkaea orientalis (strain PCC 8801 / RF-1) TaxID=41431 RepID=B7JYL2_RIPO1|nr:hypothetical protein [Rippkaea orientalis]ACK64882.1 hypothetical protein PCC8801_0800 [Rippkaea orientalis PCC 8801]
MKKLTQIFLVLGGIVGFILLSGSPALGQPDSSCYMINQSGQVMDLSAICHKGVSWSTTESNQTAPASEFRSYSQVQNYDNTSQDWETDLPSRYQGYSLYSTRFPDDGSGIGQRIYSRVENRPSIVTYSHKTWEPGYDPSTPEGQQAQYDLTIRTLRVLDYFR